MLIRPKFVTNSSSSCLIVWERYPTDTHDNMTIYRGGSATCPHCGGSLWASHDENGELDGYLNSSAREVINKALANGCTIFYQIEYLGHFEEDEVEHGDDESGYYSFQC